MKRHYWDAVVFLRWLKGDETASREMEEVVGAAQNEQLMIITSSITLTEVIYIRNNTRGKRLRRESREKIRSFFNAPFIHLYSADPVLCENAQELMWDNEVRGLKHKDAIHAQTAISAEVDKLATFDPDLLDLTDPLYNDSGQKIIVDEPGLKFGNDLFS